MKTTGVIRRVDDLGRIIIPKSVRKELNIKEGEPMELFIDGNDVVSENTLLTTAKMKHTTVMLV